MKKVSSTEDITTLCKRATHVLTLFSGGLDSTYLLELLKGQGVKVTALVVDLGSGVDTEHLTLLTNHYGIDLKIVDAQKNFIEHSIVSAIQALSLIHI